MATITETKSQGSEDSDEETDIPETSDFPRTEGYFTKVELVKLALCIGFNGNLFTLHFTYLDPQVLDEPGVTTEQVLDLFYTRKFNLSIHKTMNMHPHEYNERLIRRVVKLLQGGKVGFSELKEISRIFNLYESKDGDGMTADWVTIMSALKMCDRVMSSLQLKNEMTKRADLLEIPKRLTLYELIDFYLVSQSLSYWREEVPVPELPKGVDILPFSENEIFILSLPNELEGLQYDRILTRLDDEYRMLLYQPVKTQPQKMNIDKLVNSKLRLDLYEKSQKQLKEENRKYMRSEQALWKARAGRRYSSSSPVVEKKRKKGTVVKPEIDLAQLDLCGRRFPFYNQPSPKETPDPICIMTEKEEQITDLKWEMIRSRTGYEKLIQSWEEKAVRSEQGYDPIPNILASLEGTFKTLQDEVKVPTKTGKARFLPPKRKQQILKRFESLDSSYIEKMMENWMKI